MKVLVTGANGRLGGRLVPHLRWAGLEVVTQARGAPADLRFDLSDSRAVRDALERSRPDVVINLAAYTDVDGCQTDCQRAYQGNVLTIESLVKALRPRPAFLIHLSTDQVYDGPGLKNEAQICLRNAYALSKYSGEIVAGGVPAAVLRTNFFGRTVPPARPSLSDWVVESLRRKERVTLFTDVLMSPLEVSSLCELLLLVAKRKIPGVYNLGSRDGMSKGDFAREIARALDLDLSCATFSSVAGAPFKARRPLDMRMDVSLFERTFGVTLPTLSSEVLRLKGDYEQRSVA